jgi:hypothetical protein
MTKSTDQTRETNHSGINQGMTNLDQGTHHLPILLTRVTMRDLLRKAINLMPPAKTS